MRDDLLRKEGKDDSEDGEPEQDDDGPLLVRQRLGLRELGLHDPRVDRPQRLWAERGEDHGRAEGAR